MSQSRAIKLSDESLASSQFELTIATLQLYSVLELISLFESVSTKQLERIIAAAEVVMTERDFQTNTDTNGNKI